tara:strand:- start:151 stop:624 length:474 start_codon:yes stop_codon:yes gene_type:complete
VAYKGIHTFSSKSASNIGLGQVGSVILDTGFITASEGGDGTKSGTLFQPSDGVIVALQATWTVSFLDLIPEDATLFLGDTGTGYESGGDIFDPETNSGSINPNTGMRIQSGIHLRSGMIIYGRWTGVRVYYNSDPDVGDDGTEDYRRWSQLICYIGV